MPEPSKFVYVDSSSTPETIIDRRIIASTALHYKVSEPSKITILFNTTERKYTMSISKLNGTLVYVQVDTPKPCFDAAKGEEWKSSIVISEDDADAWDEAYPKQTAKQVKTSEFEAIYKIPAPFPEQRKQYIVTLRKNTKLANGKDVPKEYTPQVFQEKNGSLVKITQTVLVANGSVGVMSVEHYDAKMGPVARLKNVKVDELIEYVKPEREAVEPGSEFDTADDGNGGKVKVPAKAKTPAKPAAKKQAEDEDDNPF